MYHPLPTPSLMTRLCPAQGIHPGTNQLHIAFCSLWLTRQAHSHEGRCVLEPQWPFTDVIALLHPKRLARGGVQRHVNSSLPVKSSPDHWHSAHPSTRGTCSCQRVHLLRDQRPTPSSFLSLPP